MGLFNVFDVAGSAMNAQSVRMNVTASNLISTFSQSLADQSGVAGVRIDGVVESGAPLQLLYQPDHPEADADGNVYSTNVNTIEEMVNMMSASRSYKNNVEMINTTKDLLLQTLSLGR